MNIIEVFEKFPTQEDCIAYLENVRWNGRPTCPYCKSDNSTPMPKEKRHHCNNCNTTYSVTVGTIFHHTHMPLQKWFLGLSLILNAKKGIAARQLARDLRVNRNTAWRIAMQVRKAMTQRGQRELLTGIVEMDECYVGGKPRKGGPKGGPKDGPKNPRGRGTKKTPVVGMVERGGNVRAKVAKKKDLSLKRLSMLVRENIDVDNSVLVTDEYKGYLGMSRILPHETINHSKAYSDGEVHTNNIESFWALLKRGIIGQYHKVSVRHLNEYVDEFCYRFNNRKNDNVFGMTIAIGLGVA